MRPKEGSDIAAQFQFAWRYQMHFTLVALAGFRVIAVPFPHRFLPLTTSPFITCRPSIGRFLSAGSGFFLSTFVLPTGPSLLSIYFGTFSQTIFPQIFSPHMNNSTHESPPSVFHTPRTSPGPAPNAVVAIKIAAVKIVQTFINSLCIRIAATSLVIAISLFRVPHHVS